ncbi:MAG TPA: hypothetical protein VGM92_08520, partial [Candidatus Kapabacteria bacterium]
MLTEKELDAYRRDGFVIVHGLFSDQELQPVIEVINEKVDALATKLYPESKSSERFEQEGFLTRLTKLEAAFPGAATLIHTGGTLPKAFA